MCANENAMLTHNAHIQTRVVYVILFLHTQTERRSEGKWNPFFSQHNNKNNFCIEMRNKYKEWTMRRFFFRACGIYKKVIYLCILFNAWCGWMILIEDANDNCYIYFEKEKILHKFTYILLINSIQTYKFIYYLMVLAISNTGTGNHMGLVRSLIVISQNIRP